MTGAELIAAFRNDTGDTASPYWWSDTEILRWLNEGQDEAARRSRMLVDSTTTAICQVTITANNPIVALHAGVLFVRRAIISGEALHLQRVRLREMDAQLPGWSNSTQKYTPWLFIPDYQTGSLRLHNIPAANGTLLLTVVRLPVAPISISGTPVNPELPARTHEALVHWAKHRAYLKEDEETKNEDLSKKALALFEVEFGPKSAAYDERWISDNYDPGEGGLY